MNESCDMPVRMCTVAESRLAALVQSAMQAGVRQVRGEIAEGSSHRVVVDMVEIFRPDVMVIGAHG